jgi:hypothetical protein
MIVVAGLLAVAAGIEVATRFAFTRISRIESRVLREHEGAVKIRRSAANDPVLFAGDSLLLFDIDMQAFPGALQRSGVHRFSMEQTTYLDWLFGLRRLFAEGSRPSLVALCLAPSNLVSNAILGDYSAYYLFQSRDIRAVAERVHYDLTKESSLFVAHYSLFFAGRNNLRNFILNRVAHPYATTLHDLLTHPSQPLTDENVGQICERRLREMEELCSRYGAHFVYVLPPGFGIREEAILQAGSRAGTPILDPVRSDAWPQSRFIDGFHLTESSAREFTAKLSPLLGSLLTSPPALR